MIMSTTPSPAVTSPNSAAVTVIVPCFNAGRYLDACLESIAAQTFGDLEVLIVDDGSTDDSPAIAAAWADRDPRMRATALSQRGGAAGARNAGLREASGGLIAFLDADDEWLPEKLTLQTEYLAERPETAMLAAPTIVIDADGRPVEMTPPRSRPGYTVCIEDFLFGTPRIATSSVIVRRAVVDDVGSFNERYRIIEDFNLWFRMVRCHRIEITDRPLIRYRVHDSNISRDRMTSLNMKISMWEDEIIGDPALQERFGKRLAAQLQQMYFKRGRLRYQRGAWAAARSDWERVCSLGSGNARSLRAAVGLKWMRLRGRAPSMAGR
jgi:glycosyltransferase involved in cell wall biosynthesis